MQTFVFQKIIYIACTLNDPLLQKCISKWTLWIDLGSLTLKFKSLKLFWGFPANRSNMLPLLGLTHPL